MQDQNSGRIGDWKTRQAVESEIQLPAERAFVVQLSLEAVPAEGRWRGRAEHVVSGQVTHFDTIEGLLAFMDHVLGAGVAQPRRRVEPGQGGP